MLARHVASACRWLIHWEVMQRAVAEVSELEHVAAAGETSHSVYRAVCAGAGKLAQAARAVLLLQDRGARRVVFVLRRGALVGVDDDGPLEALAAKYVVDVPPDGSLMASLCDALRRGIHVPGREGVRFTLRTVLPMGPFADEQGAPAGVVALFDQDFPDRERRSTADDGLGRDAAHTFSSSRSRRSRGGATRRPSRKGRARAVGPDRRRPREPGARAGARRRESS